MTTIQRAQFSAGSHPAAVGTSAETVVIEMVGLSRNFGSTVAVEDLTLTVGHGEVLGLLGPNGAGKTTTIRMLAGLIAPSAGRARVAGFEVGNAATASQLRGHVGILPEEPGLYPDLSAVATLEFYGRLYGMSKTARVERTELLLRRLSLWNRRNDPTGTFSKGMRQRLALARAMIHQPPVLFLDEPTANLDPEAAAVVRDVLGELRNEGRTIVLNTHQLEEAQRMCDRVAILRTRLVAMGSPDQLRASATSHAVTIELDEVTEAVLAVARAAAVGVVESTGRTISVRLADSALDTADLVAAIVAAGGRIRRVAPEAASLEETYLRLVGTTPAMTAAADGGPA